MRARVVAGLLIVGVTFAVIPGRAQEPLRDSGGAPSVLLRRDLAMAIPQLRRTISLRLEGVSLEQAFEAVARAADLPITYSDEILPRDRKVWLTASEIRTDEALEEILRDSGLQLLPLSSGQVVVVKSRAKPAELQVGTVSGRVTDAKTGQGLDGAEVLLEGTKWRTLADQDGQYRLAGVEAGSYTLVARRIGYARQLRAVTVVADQELTTDFALQQRPTKLEEVVVTGTVIPTEVKALPTPISVFTAEDLERHHIRRVEDAVRLAVPGAIVFDVGYAPVAVTQIALRGTSGLYAASTPKVYIDGVEASLRNQAPVDPQGIERIEVVRGPQAAAIYGSDAMGGVIQIFTKRGRATRRPEVEDQAELGVIQSDFEGSGALGQKYDAAVQGRSGPASYRVGGGYSRTGDWLPNYRSSTPSVYGSLRVDQGPLTLDLSGRYYQRNTEQTDNPRLQTAWPDLFPEVPYFLPNRARNETYALRLEYRPTGWWRHSLSAGIDRFSFNAVQTRPRLTTPADTFRSVNFQNAPKFSVAYHTAVTAALAPGFTVNVTAGADHRALTYETTLAFQALNTSGSIQFAPGSAILSRTRTTNTGVFAQAEFDVRETFFVTGAVRGEWNPDFGDELGVPLSPRVGLTSVHQLGPTTVKLRAAYGEAIRPPGAGQKAGSVNPFGVLLPNPLLKPERQIGPDLGVDLVFGRRGSLSVTYYRQLAKDLIDAVTLDAASMPQVSQNQNVARVRNTGWEFEGSLQLGAVALTGQYAITRSRAEELGPNYTGDVQVGEQMFSVPEHTAAATLTATPFQRTSIAAALAYSGRRRDYDLLAYFSCFGGTGPCNGFLLGDYVTEYPGFATLNLSVEQQLSPAVTGYVGVQDLTNTGSRPRGRDNAVAVTGRSTTIGARVRF